MSTFTMDDYRTAYWHGGMSYSPAQETYEQGRVRCALETARDMQALRDDPDAHVTWERDWTPWDGDVPYDGPLWGAILYVNGEVEGSLWSIAIDVPEYPETDPYGRVIEAELYGEYRSMHDRERAERSEWEARDTITIG